MKPNYAYFARVLNSDTLVFYYSVSVSDLAISLDCDGPDSLEIVSSGHFDGVYRAGVFTSIPADLRVPASGKLGSIGRTSFSGLLFMLFFF
jgi:hypothetical protein